MKTRAISGRQQKCWNENAHGVAAKHSKCCPTVCRIHIQKVSHQLHEILFLREPCLPTFPFDLLMSAHHTSVIANTRKSNVWNVDLPYMILLLRSRYYMHHHVNPIMREGATSVFMCVCLCLFGMGVIKNNIWKWVSSAHETELTKHLGISSIICA